MTFVYNAFQYSFTHQLGNIYHIKDWDLLYSALNKMLMNYVSLQRETALVVINPERRKKVAAHSVRGRSSNLRPGTDYSATWHQMRELTWPDHFVFLIDR